MKSRVYIKGLVLLVWVGAVMGCTTNFQLPFAAPSPTPVNQLAYDAPVSFTIKTGATLPGTTIAYGGKTDTGAARVLITGQVALKQFGDTVDWQGAPAPNTALKLNLRVASFDEQALTLAGTAHIEILNIQVTQGSAAMGTAMMEFSTAASYTLKKNELLPGTMLAFAGSAPEGAKFLGIEGYPYRKQLDSLQYVGKLGSRVSLRLDLRVISYADNNAVVGGTATIRLEQ